MSTKEDRFEIYKECFEAFSINQGELARLLNLGEPVTRAARNKISDKLNNAPGKAVPKSEAFALQALKLLHLIYERKGISIAEIDFDPSGRITQKYIESVLYTLFNDMES